jgi:hypothetical protein
LPGASVTLSLCWGWSGAGSLAPLAVVGWDEDSSSSSLLLLLLLLLFADLER